VDRARAFAPLLTEAMALYELGTPERQAIFLAQVDHESGHLRDTTELWGPTPAQRGDEGRAALGTTISY
jgi:putative chitinase